MKRVILFIVVGIFLGMEAKSQDLKPVQQVPVVVSSRLDNLYPQHQDVQWFTDGTNYMAKFIMNGLNTRVTIAESGRWVETQQDYYLENCPRNMQKHLTQTFNGYKIDGIIRSDKPDKNEYLVQLSKDNEQLTVHYDLSGKYLEDQTEKKTNHAPNEITSISQEQNTNKKPEMLPIHQKELPSNVISFIMKNYSGFTIKESYIVNNETYRNAYHVVLMNPAGDVQKLWFDFQGILINQESKEVLSSQNNKQESKKEASNPQKKSSKKSKSAHIPESKVPSAALAYFTKKVKKAENVYWDTIKKEYVVTYTDPTKNTENRMHFDEKGNFLKEVTLLKNLPPQVQTYIEKNYPRLEIYEAQNVVTADKKKYILVYIFSPYWANDPMVYHELYFTTSGSLIKEVLADYKDQDEEEYEKYQEEKEKSFIEYADQDDVNIGDVNLIDGQPVYIKDLPTPVIKHLKANYPNYVFKGGNVVTENNQLLYSLLIKKEGFKEKKRVYYDMKGNFVREENAY
jgi:hypothetical protein